MFCEAWSYKHEPIISHNSLFFFFFYSFLLLFPLLAMISRNTIRQHVIQLHLITSRKTMRSLHLHIIGVILVTMNFRKVFRHVSYPIGLLKFGQSRIVASCACPSLPGAIVAVTIVGKSSRSRRRRRGIVQGDGIVHHPHGSIANQSKRYVVPPSDFIPIPIQCILPTLPIWQSKYDK